MHCGAGVSRSAALCIAYLMRRFTWPAQRAREHCKQRRSLVNPNQGFWRSLCAFEEQLGITERSAWPRTPFWMHHPMDRCYALRRHASVLFHWRTLFKCLAFELFCEQSDGLQMVVKIEFDWTWPPDGAVLDCV